MAPSTMWILAVSIILAISIRPCTTQTHCQYELDLIFAIDGSNSMFGNNFNLQKKAVEDLIQNLRVGRQDIHVGLVLFSLGVSSVPLSGNKSQIISDLKSFQYPDETTATDLAIDEATRLFESGRGGRVRQLLVIVTDGRSNNMTRTLRSAANAKQRGIVIYTVGVTNAINTQELRDVSSYGRVTQSRDFNSLYQDLLGAVNEACDAVASAPPVVWTPAPPVPLQFVRTPPVPLQFVRNCNYQLDLIFALDSSNSLFQHDFDLEKQAVVQLLMELNITPTDINVGLVLFSDVVTSVPLSGNKQKVISDAADFLHADGTTRTDLAITEATRLFENGRGGNVRQLLVIITDGRATDHNAALSAANVAKNRGIRILTVGVTNAIDMTELTQLASSQGQVYYSQNFQTLRQDLLTAVNQACFAISTAPPPVWTRPPPVWTPAPPPTTRDCDYQLDVVFAIDGSNSMFESNFNLERQALVTLIQSLNVSPRDINVGLVLFSDNILSRPLSGNKQQIIADLNTFPYPGEATFTDRAIRQAMELFRTARGGNVKQLLVIITDGRATDRDLAIAASDDAKYRGIQIYTVGVTNAIDERELQILASSPRQVFTSDNFQSLRHDLMRAVNEACIAVHTATPPPTTPAPPTVGEECNYQLDLVIAVDSSNSLFEREFNTQKQALTNLVTQLNINQNDIHVGLVVFSDVVQSYPLSGNKQGVLRDIQAMPFYDESTRTDLAIQRADQLFQNARGGKVRKLLVIVTDGRATDQNAALAAARRAKNDQVIIYAVGVTDAIDQTELRLLATSPRQVFFSHTYAALLRDLLQAVARACRSVVVPPSPSPEDCNYQLDLIIAIDGSNSIYESDFTAQKNAVANLVSNLNVSPRDIHVGVVGFSNTVTSFPLNGDKQQVMREIYGLPFLDETTRTDLAIERASDLFLRGRGGNVTQLLLIVTDGRATNHDAAVISARNAKSTGIAIYIVGVTNAIDEQELRLLASTPQQVFFTNNFHTLRDDLIQAANRACQTATIIPPTPRPYECNYEMELVIAFDGSNSVFQNRFNIAKSAISNLVRNLNVTDRDIRVGLIVFSSSVSSFPLSGNKNQIMAEITNLPYEDDVTRTDLAIQRAIQIFRGARSAPIRKLLIIITDGRSTLPAQTRAAANQAKQSGVSIFTIGVTNAIYEPELRELASTRSQMYLSQDFTSLRVDLVRATNRACRFVNTTAVPYREIHTHLCSNSGHLQGRIGHVAHPSDCNKYIQCYYNPITRLELAVVRHCPLGEFWDTTNTRCRLPTHVQCFNDPCTRRPSSRPYGMTGSSRGYWQCVNRVTTGFCCPMYQSFVSGRGCVQNPNSNEFCEVGNCTQNAVCQKKPNWSVPSSYQVVVAQGVQGWFPRPCTYHNFDVVDCACSAPRARDCLANLDVTFRPAYVFGHQVFNYGASVTESGVVMTENSYLQLDLRSYNSTHPITLTLRYRESRPLNANGQALVSTSYCQRQQYDRLDISVNDQGVHVKITTLDNRISETVLPTEGFSPNDVKELTFIYDQDDMAVRLSVGGLSYIEKINAPNGVTFPCGLDIGARTDRPGFSGTIQGLSVYPCSLGRLY